MIRFRIRLSGWAPKLLIVVLSGSLSLLPARLFAQCSGALGKITYDTSVISTPFGTSTANGSFSYSVPQFSASLGTLYATVIQSTVSASATAVIENFSGYTNNSPQISLFRSDGITSSVTGSVNGTPTFSGVYTGAPLANFSAEPIPMPGAVSNDLILNDSTTNAGQLSGFTGSGSVPFTYSSNNIPLPPPSSATINTQIFDTVNFSISYYYCVYILSIELQSFTATLENPQTVRLAWNTANEQADRVYHIQESSDGSNFADCGSVNSDPVNSDANYAYNYPVVPNTKGRLFFRLRMVDNTGAVSYSAVCLVSLNGAANTGFSIYPNPATDFVNLILPGGNQSWNVDIIAADGNLIQRNVFSNTALGRIDFTRKLARGTYFVRATNTTSGEQHGGSFVIPQ
jgi:Secretion system C-terminal sorting domain